MQSIKKVLSKTKTVSTPRDENKQTFGRGSEEDVESDNIAKFSTPKKD